MAEQPFRKPETWQDRLILLVAQGGGFGRSPVFPGTCGSLWGLPLGLLLHDTSVWLRLAVGVAMFAVGMPLCRRAAELIGKKDPGSVVWDEIAAFPIVYAFVPITWQTLVIGFVLFRIFDITKPPPIKAFEQIDGGLGIMIDDTIAAVWAMIPLLFLTYRTNLL